MSTLKGPGIRPDPDQTIVVGSRGSPLALWQTQRVVSLLQQRFPELRIRIKVIQTRGDISKDTPLPALVEETGGQGIFIKEIEHALLQGEIDLAVHSLKDLPSEVAQSPEVQGGLVLAAVPERADARDVLVSRYPSLEALPQGARIGTSSPRRAVQLHAYRPDLRIMPLRGNLGTRLRKAIGPDLDGAILAAAGVLRLDQEKTISQYLPLEICLPAVGQGALAVQARRYDCRILEMCAAIDDPSLHQAVLAERAFMQALGGGCQVPMAAYAEASGEGPDGKLRLQGLVAHPETGRILRDEVRGPVGQAQALGHCLAERLRKAEKTAEQGRVYLVGAGPGDPGLITVRGRDLLRRAEVVVYDRLVDERLLAEAPQHAKRIYVGKQATHHTLKQEEINDLLVSEGLAGKIVVRLKGGDPYVFGRGSEEALALRRAGIAFEVVPGVTSAIAVPSYAGIPATHRRVAASFTIVTGHEDPEKDESQVDWDRLPNGTLVFLMGAENLAAIATKLMERGHPDTTPAAFIHQGTTPRQRTVTGTLADIARRVGEAGLGPPGVVVIGNAVSLRKGLEWFEERPLFGCRVLVTRSREQASALSALLSEEGALPLELPTIQVQPMNDYYDLDAAIAGLHNYDWVCFTSANGVSYFWERLRRAGKDARALPLVCTIGPATTSALAKQGIVADLQPAEFVAEALAKALAGQGIAGRRVLLPRAEEAREMLPRELRRMGATVDEVAAYRTVLPEASRERLAELLPPAMQDDGTRAQAQKGNHIDAVTFTSSSTVRNMLKLLNGDISRLAGLTLAAIGPVTARTLREAGLPVDVEAREYTIPGLVHALKDYFAARRAAPGSVDKGV